MEKSIAETPSARSRLHLALVAAILVLIPIRDDAKPARLILATSGSCITMSADPVSGYDLANACSVCRTGIVSWCDGEGHPFDVHANSTLRIPACPGIQTLVTDVPCEHPH